MNKFQALQKYWSSFSDNGTPIPAFNELSVPPTQKGKYKYITYQPAIGSLDGIMTLSGSLWDRGTSWGPIYETFASMEPNLIKEIPFDGGILKIRTPNATKAQPMDEPSDDLVKRLVITIEAEFLSA